MPPIYYMNPPPNPFWDFVAGLEDHPLFTGPSRHPNRHHGGPPPHPPRPAPGATPEPPRTTEAEMSEKSRGKQATAEDPPEVDPSTVKPEADKAKEGGERQFPFRGRGRFGNAFEGGEGPCQHGRRDHPCRSGRGGRGRRGWNGPPPFMMGHPFFGPGQGPWARDGPPPHGPPPHGPPPHAHGPHGHQRRPSPPSHVARPGFDLGELLNKLGDKLGVDLSNAAEGLGLTADRFTAGRTGQDVNFEPRTDIFENKQLFTIHLSVPGAKKSDIGVDYDGEHSILRITGVVHRPEVDEEMLGELVVDGRKRETGVFEKAIRLGTKRDPANIDVGAISAKMTDGVLVVKIPKIDSVPQKREVPITADAVEEGQADYEDEYSEKPVLFDAEDQASNAPTEIHDPPKKQEISLLDMDKSDVKDQPDTSSHTVAAVPSKQEEATKEQEKAKTQIEEQLPAYAAEPGFDHDESDWEKFSDASGEGEYIKINVD